MQKDDTQSANNTATEVVKLTPPQRPTKENIVGYNFGIRPYRKGGVRLERQEFRNKVFYHNYGHGGGGVSLAYGCSKYIVDLFIKSGDSNNNKEVAVIGCGYMGLMEAILLADLGFKVNVYTKDFPKILGVYEDKACITSQVAGGLWMPYGLEVQDKSLHYQLGKLTLEYYKECIDNKKYQGLSYKDAYLIDSLNPIEEFCAPGLVPSRDVYVDFGNGAKHHAVTFRTVLMDGDTFLNELFEECKKKGVNFTTRSFDDILDLCELKERCIFNCTGAYSRVLFNDTNIVPIVGHLLYMKRVPGLEYFLSTFNRDKSMRVTTYPQGNKLAVGLTYEERGWLDKPDIESVNKLIKNLEEFLDWKVEMGPKPKL